MFLLGKKGYSTRDMDPTFKSLGAICEECHGSVENWLASLTKVKISNLIDQLEG